MNPAARALFKTAEGETLDGDQLTQILPRGLFDDVFACDQSLLLPETTVRATDGEEIPVRLAGACLESSGRLLGGAISLTDQRQIRALEAEKLEAERLAAVGQTVAGLAHGIKNQLTGLEGGMYLLTTGLKKGNQKRVDTGWEMLDRNVDRITTLVKGFLSFSKKHVPVMEMVDPRDIAREIYSLYDAAAKRDGVALLFEAEQGIAAANMEASGIHTCLANLVSNAIDACKASKKHGGTVSLRVREGDGATVFEVEDTGCGMDAQFIRDRLFRPFDTTKGNAGMGIGVYESREFIINAGGSIDVHSEPGHGTTFRVCLNLEKQDTDAQKTQPQIVTAN